MNIRPTFAAAVAAAALLAVVTGCAAGEGMTRQALFDSAPSDLSVQSVTVEVTGRRSTLWGDEEAEARLRRVAGVLDVGRPGGRNRFMVLMEQTISPEALVMSLEGDFVVHIVEVVKRPDR